jgi:hypothetical protein
MSASIGNGKQSSLTSNDDPSYEDYMDEVENMRHRNKGSSSYDLNKVLTHLGLPEYEYVDAQNYDYLLPTHLTYGKDQTVKLHNAKKMSCEISCRVNVVRMMYIYKRKKRLREKYINIFFVFFSEFIYMC